MGKLRIGVVGCGHMGTNHARIYQSLASICELAGVYDNDQVRSRQAADAFGTISFESYEALLDAVDAMSIVVPTRYHYEAALIALNHGKHILVEKPFAATMEQGKLLMDAAHSRQLVLQVGHVERFNPAVQMLPGILAGKRIIGLDFKRMGPYDPRVNDVDVVQDLMIHDLDVLRHILPNPVAEMKAAGSSPMSGGLVDYAVATALLEDGIIACFTASRVSVQKTRTLAITTEQAVIKLDYMEKKIELVFGPNKDTAASNPNTYRRESIVEKVFVPSADPLRLELESFLRCVERGETPLADGNDGLQAMKLVEAVRKNLYS